MGERFEHWFSLWKRPKNITNLQGFVPFFSYLKYLIHTSYLSNNYVMYGGYALFLVQYMNPITRGVQTNPATDPHGQHNQFDPRTGRPDVGDGWQRVSTSKTRDWRAGWRVWTWKIEKTNLTILHWKSSCSPPMGAFRRLF